MLLRNGYAIGIQRPTEDNSKRGQDRWWLALNRRMPLPGRVYATNRKDYTSHDDLDEFEAQALFDHYCLTYGV